MSCILICARDNVCAVGKRMATMRKYLVMITWAISLAAVAQEKALVGVVQTADRKPVAHENVIVENAALGPYETSDSGKFIFPLIRNLSVGREAIFRVESTKKNRWVVVVPCDRQNGRKDSLPVVGGEPVTIIVTRWGSPGLKREYGPNCLLEEFSSRLRASLRPKADGTGSTEALLTPESPGEHFESGNRILPTGKLVPVSTTPSRQRVAVPSPTTGQASPYHRPPELDNFLAEKAEELGLTSADLVEMIDSWVPSVKDPYQRGLAAIYQGRYAEASQYIRESITTSGSDVLDKYVALASAEYGQGHLGAAEQALRAALKANAEDTLVLNNLGVVLVDKASYAEAENLLTTALKLDRQAFGEKHPVVGDHWDNLGVLYSRWGQYSKAEGCILQALEIHTKAYGKEHIEVATDKSNLGLLYTSLTRFGEARPLLEDALKIAQNIFGPEHLSVAIAMTNLATLYYQTKDFSGAEGLLAEALRIEKRNSVASDDPNQAATINNLATVYVEQKKYSQAELLLETNLKTAEEIYGPEHPLVATALNNLAILYLKQNQYEKAEPLLQRALTIDTASGRQSLKVATDLNNLAFNDYRLHKYEEGEALLKQALTMHVKIYGARHPYIAEDLEHLAMFSRAQGKEKEAQEYDSKAREIREGTKNP
jgi:tetratricopeptide (TPR) repeat protein